MEAYLWRTVMWYGGVGRLAADVIRSLALPPKYFRLVVAEIEIMGIRSLGVALTASIFTGMVFALQSAVYLARFGADLYIGPLVGLSVLRELGPVLTAILVGGKVASGITAELGSMKVTEQIDALRAIGVNHVKRLIVPRVLAAFFVFPLLTTLADFVTDQKNYLSGDGGLAFAPELDEASTYLGTNIYSRPINKKAALSQFGNFWQTLDRRTALTLGLTVDGIGDDVTREDLIGSQSLLVGLGVRLTEIAGRGGGL